MAKIDFDKKFSGLSRDDFEALRASLKRKIDLAESKKAADKIKTTNINKKVQPQAGILNNKEKNIMAKSKIEKAPEAGAKKTETEGEKYWGEMIKKGMPSPESAKSKYEAVKNLASDKEIDAFLNSKEFREKEKEGGESRKTALAEWLSQKRWEKGHNIEDINREHAESSEDRRKAYEKWDWYRAEEILDKFGDAYVDENFGQRPDKKAAEAPTAEPIKEIKDLDEKEKIITGKMEEGLAEMKEKTKSPEEFLKEAREKFVKALLDKEKADKAEGKLTGVRGWLSRHFGKGAVDPNKAGADYWEKTLGQRPDSAVMEKNAATVNFERARQELKDALQNYRSEKLAMEEQSLRNQGLSPDKIDKYLQRYAQELLTETTVKEAANIYDLKKGEMARGASADKSTWEWTKSIFMNVSQAYRKWPTKYKILASVGLLGGAWAGATLGGGAALAIGGCVVTGRGLQRILGGMSATVGTEALMKRSQEKQYGRRITKEMSKEMSGNFVKALQEKGNALDDRMFEMLGKQNFNEKKRWGLSLALGAGIGSGYAAQAWRYGIGLIPSGVKAAVAEHIDKIWRPQDYAAQYEQWKEQIAGRAGQLRDEATPYYESAKDYAGKVWDPWREKVYSALGIGQGGERVFEVPDNYGAGAGGQSSLGGSSLGNSGGGMKGVAGGAFNPDAGVGKGASYYDLEAPTTGKDISGIDDELLAGAKSAGGGVPYDTGLSGEMRPGGTAVPDLYEKSAGGVPGVSGEMSPGGTIVPEAPGQYGLGPSGEMRAGGTAVPDLYEKGTAGVKPFAGGVSGEMSPGGTTVPEGAPYYETGTSGAGRPSGVPDAPTEKIASSPPVGPKSFTPGLSGELSPGGAGVPEPPEYYKVGPGGEGRPGSVGVPEQPLAGEPQDSLPPEIDNKAAGAFGPTGEQLPVDNKIAGALGPQAEQATIDNKAAGAFGPQPEQLPADNKIAAAFGPQAESLSGAEIAKRGDSVWKMLDRQLQSRYGETFTGLDAAKRTYLIDAFENKVAENPAKFGLTNIDKVQLGKNYDFSSLFENQDVVQKQFEVAGALKEAAMKNILENNKTLEDWMSSHKGQALTSEKVEEILRSGKAANLSEAIADNSSGGKILEAVTDDVSPAAESSKTGELIELVPTDESGQPLAGQSAGAPEKLNALPENPPQDVSGRIEEMFTANETANRDALGFRNAAEYKAVRDIKVGKLLEQVPANKDEAWAIYRQEAPGRSIDLPSYGAIGPTPAKFGRLIELSKFIDSFKPGAGAKEMTVSQFLKMTGPEQLVGH